MPSTRRGQWLVTGGLVLATASLWLIPSNLAYCVAEKRAVLLGRYSLEWFSGLLALTLALPPTLYLVWAGDARERRLRSFRLTAASISVVLCVVAVDVALRLTNQENYTVDGSLYHRPPNKAYDTIERDVPGPGFAYAFSSPGYPDRQTTLTTDDNGFRNKAVPDKADILAIGDSFAEGSHVSDDQVWPVLLGQLAGKTVYNLGMSGSRPGQYLETLRRYGTKLRPSTVLVMLYEGNDFRDSGARESGGPRPASLTKRIKRSPLLQIVRNHIIDGLSFQGGPDAVAAIPALSWLPLALPPGQGARHYAFDLDRLKTHWPTEQEFENAEGCQATFDHLRQMKQLCDDNGARLVVVFAPDTPHVIMPALGETLPAGKVRSFLAIKMKNLPPEDRFLGEMLRRLEAMENVMRRFCLQEAIDFHSPTSALRKRSAEGVQTYFTYDQHWTPEGHAVVAKGLADFLAQSGPAPAGS